jgi:putative endonuclease
LSTPIKQKNIKCGILSFLPNKKGCLGGNKITVVCEIKRAYKMVLTGRHKDKAKKQKKRTIFLLYVLESKDGKRTYVGVTKNLRHRLRQHNGVISGGAKATRGRNWRVALIVKGFISNGAALSLEKSIHNKGKHMKRIIDEGVLERRVRCVRGLIQEKGLHHLQVYIYK